MGFKSLVGEWPVGEMDNAEMRQLKIKAFQKETLVEDAVLA
jgi:hypothetical protein